MQHEFIEYAPILIVVIAFLIQHKIFVTPGRLKEELENLEKKFVLRETNDIIINGIKEDISEIKQDIALIKEQNNRMYNKLIGANT